MIRPFADHSEFFRQFRRQFHTTGAVAPSSRFLAHAMTGPLQQRQQPARILEVGPGTGAVTRRIVQLVGPEDSLDLVELNEAFVDRLKWRFQHDPLYQHAADRSQVHLCALQDFETAEQYDYIISGLPLNNFSSELVGELFEVYFRLLAPAGILSYFEYMFVRPLRKMVGRRHDRQRLAELDAIMSRYQARHRIRKNWVFVNLPPAWVQHLQNDGGLDS